MNKLYVAILGLFVLFSCNQTEVNNKIEIDNIDNKAEFTTTVEAQDTIFNFENYKTGKLPESWSQFITGRGNVTNWKIVDDQGNKVLAQLSDFNPNYHFNVVVFDSLMAKNMELKVKLKGVAGKLDQGGGFIWRYTDANNYYVVRANPLEDNVVLYKVVGGRRTDLPLLGKGRTYGVDVEKLGNDWNTLALKVEGDLFTVFLNDKELFKVKDESIKGEGKIGLWTKADAVTYFDDYEISIR